MMIPNRNPTIRGQGGLASTLRMLAEKDNQIIEMLASLVPHGSDTVIVRRGPNGFTMTAAPQAESSTTEDSDPRWA